MIGLFRRTKLSEEWSQAGRYGASGFSRFGLGLMRGRFRIRAFLLLLGLGCAGYGLLYKDDSLASMHGANSYSFAGESIVSLRAFVRSNPDNILRMVGRDISVLLEEPELVRADFPTVVWQYRKDNCVLDVYFASSAEDVLDAPVVHYEARYRDAGGLDKPGYNCLVEITSEQTQVVALDDFGS